MRRKLRGESEVSPEVTALPMVSPLESAEKPQEVVLAEVLLAEAAELGRKPEPVLVKLQAS